MMSHSPNRGDGWTHWPAPAKLNLFLRILGRRSDGYHELQTVFRLLNWGDTVHLRIRNDGVIARLGDSAPHTPEAQDLMVRAARLLQAESDCALGVDIRIDKRIPTGGGFGGGSSDAATVLRALSWLWGLAMDLDALSALGLQLGADIPVFIQGRNAWAEGVGERLTPLALAPAWYVLVDPEAHVSTATLFQSPDLTRAAEPATIADFVSGVPLGNAFEPVARRRESQIEAAFEVLASIGTPRLTGSGSGCFVEFHERAAAEAALQRLPKTVQAWVAEGADHSPLLDALVERNDDLQ